MKNKYIVTLNILIILIILIIFNISFADNKSDNYEPDKDAGGILIDPEYTTIYENDEINLKIGFDDAMYKNEPIYISFDKNIFELDLSNIKPTYDRYKLKTYEIKEEKNIIKYILYFEVNNLVAEKEKIIGYEITKTNPKDAKIIYIDDLTYMDIYNEIIDEPIFTNIKLKVKENVPFGTYLVESGSDSTDKNILPITIIKNENKSKTLKYLYNEENYNGFVYGVCNDKCKITGIGNNQYRHSTNYENDFGIQLKIKYIDEIEYEYHGILNFPTLESNLTYNTIYQNDETELIISRSDNVLSKYVIFDSEKMQPSKSNNDNYQALPIYITYDSTIFDIDTNDIKTIDDNYIFKNYKKITNGNIVKIMLNFEIKNLSFDLNEKNRFSKEIFKIKVKSKKSSPVGRNLIQTTIGLEEDEMDKKSIPLKIDSNNPNEIIDSTIINIINKNKISYDKVEMYLEEEWSTVTDEKININLNKNKNNYYFTDTRNIKKTNIICSEKCNYTYKETIEDNKYEFETTINYENGTSKKYKIMYSNLYYLDDSKLEIIPNEITMKDVIVIGNKDTQEKYKIKVENYISEKYIHLMYKYYDYDIYENLSNVLKEELKIELDESKLPFIYINYNEKNINNSIYGELTDEELENILNETFGTKIDDNNESIQENVNDKTNSDDLYIENDNEESNSIMFIVIIGISLAILSILIIVLIVIKNKKIKNKQLEQSVSQIKDISEKTESIISDNENS